MKSQDLKQQILEEFDDFWGLQFPNSHPAEYGVTKKFLSQSLETLEQGVLGEVRERLKEANILLRSAYSIAEREGLETNWEAFRGQVKKELDLELPVINALTIPKEVNE